MRKKFDVFFPPKDDNLGVLKSIATTTCRWVSEGGGAGRVVGGSGVGNIPQIRGRPEGAPYARVRVQHSARVTFAPDRILSTQRVPGGRVGAILKKMAISFG